MEQEQDESPGRRDPEEIRQEIDDWSQRVASLYGRSSEIHQQRARIIDEVGSISGPVPYERLRERLEPSRLELGSIASEVKQSLEALARLQDELRSGPALGADDEKPASESVHAVPKPSIEDVLRLQKRLHEIADAQIESVLLWNEDPREQGRGAFETKFRELHQAYHETLAELNRLRLIDEKQP
jgi:hypothetical protein